MRRRPHCPPDSRERRRPTGRPFPTGHRRPHGRPLPWSGLPGNAPGRSGLPRNVLARNAPGAAGMALALGLLAGCGTSAASTPNADQTCGTTRTGVNVPVIIKITKGQVSCATALRVENSYAAVVRAGQIRGNGGGAPVAVSGWTCRGFPTPEVLKTGRTSACHNGGGSEILAVLPPPSAPGVPVTPTASA